MPRSHRRQQVKGGEGQGKPSCAEMVNIGGRSRLHRLLSAAIPLRLPFIVRTSFIDSSRLCLETQPLVAARCNHHGPQR